jgi:hypothetical protein
LAHLALTDVARNKPSAAASLREGLAEMFTINRIGLPARLRKCLGTTNVIDSTHSGARQKTRRVTNWANGAMALRWSAAAFVETERNYRRISGYDALWMLRAHLDEASPPRARSSAGNDEAPTRRRKPYRYRWPDDVRDEVLARLLALNEERAKQKALQGAAATNLAGKARKKRGTSPSQAPSPDLFSGQDVNS